MSIIFTKRGYKRLMEIIKETERKLKQVIKEKAEAGSGQDTWHDEGFRIGVTNEIMWSKRLGELQSLLRSAQVVTPEEQNKVIRIGNGVIVEYEDGSVFKFILEGHMAGKLEAGVSTYSSLGKIVLGAKIGEERVLDLPETGRDRKY